MLKRVEENEALKAHWWQFPSGDMYVYVSGEFHDDVRRALTEIEAGDLPRILALTACLSAVTARAARAAVAALPWLPATRGCKRVQRVLRHVPPPCALCAEGCVSADDPLLARCHACVVRAERAARGDQAPPLLEAEVAAGSPASPSASAATGRNP